MRRVVDAEKLIRTYREGCIRAGAAGQEGDHAIGRIVVHAGAEAVIQMKRYRTVVTGIEGDVGGVAARISESWLWPRSLAGGDAPFPAHRALEECLAEQFKLHRREIA